MTYFFSYSPRGDENTRADARAYSNHREAIEGNAFLKLGQAIKLLNKIHRFGWISAEGKDFQVIGWSIDNNKIQYAKESLERLDTFIQYSL